eukprot:CAMPEP_0179038800 /NCGR_PEP_ID=MMETSP0796-20121207/14820_1 /TAXON_ID=73915 /ORGANISM="Pyrodinium bahamense, Strain pbaha01" /LENGTH=42 /DNA_ID= /DNA_START= /DNA_END= /DNA_ORIENTATION=
MPRDELLPQVVQVAEDEAPQGPDGQAPPIMHGALGDALGHNL